MFCVIYCWRIKPELEDQFIENWAAITRFYIENRGGLGSRLHRGEDGLFYAYAQWKSSEAREKAFENFPDMPEREKMREAILESLPEIRLDAVEDLLQFPVSKNKI
ncbi:MAG: antibiotic biosynthesis monooxygenase family protein [Pyrinomonadaceae bacterium]